MSDQNKFNVARYNANSYIIVNGDTNNKAFFIVQEGDVKISNNVEALVDDDVQVLKKGDFFGVESCMGNLTRIEGAYAMSQTLCIAVYREQFPHLIQRSSSIAMKIIRSFSQKLRKYDHLITQLSLKSNGSTQEEDDEKLFSGALYYKEHSNFPFAFKMLLSYIKLFPNGRHLAEVKKMAIDIKPYCEGVALDYQLNGLNAIVPKNFLLFAEGEPGNRLFIIQKGKVNITKILDGKEVMIAVLKEGDIFGEMALLENKGRTANAITAEDCVFLTVEQKNFNTMVETQPALATKLITLLSERTWVAYRQLENSLLGEPIARIWDTLLIQMQKNRAIPEDKGVFVFPFSFKSLVKMVGLPEHESVKYKSELIATKKFEENEEKIICRDTSLILKQVEFYQKMILRKEKISKRE